MDSAEAQRTTQNSGIKVRRPRAARACDLCRAKKNKCDELYPCTYCKNRGATCVYKGQDMSRRHYTPEYVRQLEEQVKSLSALAESQSQKAQSTDDNASVTATIPEIAEGFSPADCNLQRRPSRSTTVGSPSNARSRNAAGQEVSGVNRHTRNVEFYGSSSSVALLSHVQRTGEEPVVSNDLDSDAGTLLSNLHNPAFSSPAADQPQGGPAHTGADLYHNRQFPIIGETENEYSSSSDLVDPPSCAIIKSMVDYSKVIRSICLGIYLPETTVPRTVTLAHQIDQDLQKWVESLPEPIRPTGTVQPRSLKSAKEAQWMKRQRLVLTMRYLNLKILLFGSILLTSTSAERASIPGSHEGIQTCLESAKQTIEIIYQTYQHHDFFRTWFYNTTYTVFAASMILVYVTQEAVESELQPLLKLVGMAIEILETMDECVVALRSAKLLHKAIEKAEKKFSASTPSAAMIPAMPPADAMLQLNHYWGPLNILDNEMDFGFAMQFADFEGTNSLFMALDDQRTM
ncbi:putative transcriptional regulatory protein [Colletotrichum sp. SAR 10_86]|nr:putative transcriptional regulatory protein [Colletotrichum sp. SAR 10_75]KAI8204448.1 putative transcriptional regulatory protein [Colletotrichum sp. SAR 10_65]KAI8213742.1 putative transcriptional regulatory protein [Colletotrichum sp. SAR 10_76]KAI8228564.1 putative transcriptional regulatory protein [Colletotrichum sp. SAR 10_86]KAJ5004648.1 putative transcriptional regulatory protein [Colletotrichum sp. SAR 10_66]